MNKKAKTNLIFSLIIEIINIILPLLSVVSFYVEIGIGKGNIVEDTISMYLSWAKEIGFALLLMIWVIISYILFKKNKKIYITLMSIFYGFAIIQTVIISIIGLFYIGLSGIITLFAMLGGKVDVMIIGIMFLGVWLVVMTLLIVGVTISMKNTYSKKMYEELEGGKEE